MADLLILVPGRLGSKGVPGKNFRKIGTKTLIERSITHARQFSDIADIVVSTDNLIFIDSQDSMVKPGSSNFDGNANFLETSWGYFHRRPNQFATDQSLIMDLAYHLVFDSALALEKRYRAILLLQPTTPFRSVAEIRQVKAKLLENSIESQSFFSVKDASDSHPARMYESSGPGRFQGIHCYEEYREYRRQDCPKIFIRDGGYYIIGRDLIKERKQTASLANGIVRDFPYSINIDSESDLLLSQLLLDKITDDPNGLESS